MLTAALLFSAVLAAAPAAKLDPAVSKEMAAAIVTVNKALGLESWKGPEVCVDWGGLEATHKDVTPEAAKTCAASAVEKDFPGLGKDYILGIVMADIGPASVFAVGINEAEGYGAYSCDYGKKCNPTKLSTPSKPMKRLVDRIKRGCADKRTVWLPQRGAFCDAM